ncbi:MAG: helix-turn-helix domain-containing protein [Legionella sp.]|nr:helix-turn-helix domain-containing protein [Legionella sp.]
MNPALQTNLKKLMIKHSNMSVSDLAKATGLPQPTLYQLYTGVTENPRKKTLIALADYFSVTVSQLLGEAPLPVYLPEKTKVQLELNTAPLLTLDDLYHWPNQINLDHKKEIFLDNPSNHTTFAITMPDNSMEPLFPNGCLLIFDTEKTARDQDCAIVFLNATNQFVFKKILMRNELIYAQSVHATHNNPEAILLAPQDKVFAALREARLSFEA